MTVTHQVIQSGPSIVPKSRGLSQVTRSRFFYARLQCVQSWKPSTCLNLTNETFSSIAAPLTTSFLFLSLLSARRPPTTRGWKLPPYLQCTTAGSLACMCLRPPRAAGKGHVSPTSFYWKQFAGRNIFMYSKTVRFVNKHRRLLRGAAGKPGPRRAGWFWN